MTMRFDDGPSAGVHSFNLEGQTWAVLGRLIRDLGPKRIQPGWAMGMKGQ